jgi:hypothetical protein
MERVYNLKRDNKQYSMFNIQCAKQEEGTDEQGITIEEG